MDETFNDDQKKKGISKGIIAFIVAILVIGGSVAAYLTLNISEKEKYFLSEKKSIEFMTDKFEERYQPELDWYEQSVENPTENKFTLSGEYNDPDSGGLGVMGPEQFINNSTIEITTASDMKEQQISTKLKADIGGIEVDDIDFYLTSKEITLGLPFISELLQVKGDDLGKLLHEMDPMSFDKDEDIDLETLFNGSNGTLSDEDIEYLEKEYLDMIYNDLPEEAFKSTDDKIKVNDESMKTEKITMHLTEKQLKEMITKVLDKMEGDKKLKDLITEQIELQQFGVAAMDDEIDELMTDFESGIADAKEAVKDFKIPDGLTSVIWIKDDLIVQRDFNIEMGTSEQELVAFSVKGTQSLENDNQLFNYDLGFSDAHDEGTMNLSGDLSWKDDKAKDSINLTVADTVLSYDGTETLKDGKRDFERAFSFEDPSGVGGSLIWDGNASYDKDQMNSEHNLSIKGPGIDQDMFALQVAVDGKTINKVEIPDDGDVKDLGSMSVDEIMHYFEDEVAPSFQQWMMKMIGAGGLGF